jgi:peptide/nickel transport system permease protein
MARFLLQRIVLAVVSVWAICTITFFIAALSPGDPALLAAGQHADAATLARIRHDFGLDAPVSVRYGRYLWGLLHGDLGRSFLNHIPITDLLKRGLPPTAILAVIALLVALLAGVPSGIAAALKPNKLLDRVLMSSVLVGVSLPNFILAPLLILIFALKLGWLPVAGYGNPEDLVLPALVLAARPAALIARMTRSSMLETLQQDYIRTARASGLPPFKILTRYALKNAFLPVLTAAATSFGYLLSGSFVVETTFTIPGVGGASIISLTTRDYTLIQGTILLLAVIFVTINLIVDVLYALLDPRVKVTG